MAGKPYIDDDPFDEPPGKRDEDIDTGPLTLPQLQGLARDQIAALRHTVQEILNQEPQVDGESVLDLLDMLAATIGKKT
jgi:hypothetical protein